MDKITIVGAGAMGGPSINGAVARAAGEAGMEVPLDTAMVALVKGMERAWEQFVDA